MKNLINLKVWKRSLIVIFALVIFANLGDAQIASGGNYSIEQSVTANGGASGSSASVGGIYKVEGTIGQSAAGTQQQNGTFRFQPGFWTPAPFAPTAAEVAVSGRVTTAEGRGIQNVFITMTGGNGETRTAISSTFGYYHFINVAAGDTYVFEVRSKRYTFNQPTLVRSIIETVDDLNFVAAEPGQ